MLPKIPTSLLFFPPSLHPSHKHHQHHHHHMIAAIKWSTFKISSQQTGNLNYSRQNIDSVTPQKCASKMCSYCPISSQAFYSFFTLSALLSFYTVILGRYICEFLRENRARDRKVTRKKKTERKVSSWNFRKQSVTEKERIRRENTCLRFCKPPLIIKS